MSSKDSNMSVSMYVCYDMDNSDVIILKEPITDLVSRSS